MDRKTELEPMQNKEEKDQMDLDAAFPRDDAFSRSYDETPLVSATSREPTGMRPRFFEESILKHRKEIERLHQLLAERNQQLNEQGNLIDKMKAPFEPATVTDPTLTPRVPRPQDIAYEETMRRQKAQ
jgi:hypothetical protein